jgi:2-amino-4-hydroxy-6-hydroxymethyldihydropteridine diphosphokinase
MGDREAHLVDAVRAMAPWARLKAASSLYETAPVGGPPQPWYLNAVVAVDTELSPLDLLRACQEVEIRAGRRRTVRWGPRTLDVDLLWYDHRTMRTPELTLPHPRARERRFVLEPWHEIWPDGQLDAESLEGLLDQVLDQPLVRWKLPRLWVPV